MKTSTAIHRTALATVMTIPMFAFGESALEREMKQLQDQLDKAAALSVEPINRRYATSLEPLLKRAMQANDLDAALKIRQEMQKFGAASQAGAAGAGGVTADLLTSKLIGTKWNYFGRETLTFLVDGKAQWSSGGDLWTWKIASAGRRIIEGENAVKKAKFTMTFDHDLKTGTIEGDGGKRQTRNITNE